MEILFVSYKYPPSIGGMEKQSFELINGIKQHVKVHTIIYDGRKSLFHFFLGLNSRIKQVCLKNPEISIIHFNDATIAAFSLLHTGYKQLKQTMTVHGLDIVFPLRIYQQYIIPKFNRFDKIFAVSQATADACMARRIKAEKIVVINNGINLNIAPITTRTDVDRLIARKYGADITGKHILAAIGRPVKRKGFSWFIKNVLPLLNDNFVLLLIGPVTRRSRISKALLRLVPSFIKTPVQLFMGLPADEPAIEQLIKTQPISRVLRLGKLPSKEINSILSIAKAFIMPNIEVKGDMEGFGLVCLEAGLCGTKVFASASGGITDAVREGKNGFLLPPGDVNAWANKLNALLDAQSYCGWSAENSQAFIRQNFSWDKMVTSYLAEFKKLQPANDSSLLIELLSLSPEELFTV